MTALYLIILIATARGLGYARDEGFYFQAARSYQRWFELLAADPAAALQRVDRYWVINHEHPALLKSSFALSHLLLFDRLGVMAVEGLSYRLPAMVLSACAVGLSYLWGVRSMGRLAGLVAAVSLAAAPRFFFHAHLACFDAPIVTLWLLTAYCYWRALERGGWMWPMVSGLAFGLALDAKHNAWFLPIVCLTHAAMWLLSDGVRQRGRRLAAQRAAAVLASMALLGPLVMVGGWPWLWHDTVARLGAYASFHLHHVYYNMELLGRNYWRPPMPRSYAWVMTAATVPTVVLLASAVGAGRCVRRELGAWRRWWGSRGRRRAEGRGAAGTGARLCLAPRVARSRAACWLWGLAVVVQYAAWLSPRTPIFGGTKHWMTAYPFLVLFAGAGARAAALAARRWWRSRIGRVATTPELGLLVLLLAAPVAEAAHAHPWGLSAYTPLVGGAPGAASLGLNRGFWGYTTAAVLPYLNRTAPTGARIYIHDTAHAAWDMLRRDHRLRADLRVVASVAQADLALYHHELHMRGQEQQAWVAFGTVAPAHIAGLDGVPVIWVYRRRGR